MYHTNHPTEGTANRLQDCDKVVHSWMSTILQFNHKYRTMVVKQKMYEIGKFCTEIQRKLTYTVEQHLYDDFICREI
jgi:hypothetical protein